MTDVPTDVSESGEAKPVAYITADGEVLAVDDGGLRTMFADIPDPPVGRKLLPLYAALPPARVEAAPRVKPLEWRMIHDETGMPIWRASKPFGSSYHVEGRDMDQWEWMGVIYDHLDEAKAAAQADYEARILSALQSEQPK